MNRLNGSSMTSVDGQKGIVAPLATAPLAPSRTYDSIPSAWYAGDGMKAYFMSGAKNNVPKAWSTNGDPLTPVSVPAVESTAKEAMVERVPPALSNSFHTYTKWPAGSKASSSGATAPVENGDPFTGVSAPVVALIRQTVRLLGCLLPSSGAAAFPTIARFPEGSLTRGVRL